MFVFLAPMALLGLMLLSVPIILHLFTPRKVRVLPFSSLRWLRSSQHRLSRRIKWHQLLLLLLRVAFLALLVLALAGPVFSPGRGRGKAERFIVVDVSRSMDYDSVGQSKPIDVARQLGEQLLLKGMGSDRTTVLLAGGEAQALGPLVADPSLYIARLRSVNPGLTEGDLAAPLQLIPSMIVPRRPDSTVEIFFLTANYAQSWSQGGIARFLKEMDRPPRVHVIGVGPNRPQNAWIADAQLLQSEATGKRVIRVEVGAVGDQIQERTLHLARMAGMPETTRKITIGAGPPGTADFELPGNLETKGKVAQITLQPTDALPSDDSYWLNLDVPVGIRVLVIEPESTQIRELQPGFHLRTALDALAFAEKGKLFVTQRTPQVLTPVDVAEADVILMADVPSLSDDKLTALEDRVRSGAGLAVFLGPGITREFYNTKMFNPLRPSASLLPVEIGDYVDGRKVGGLLRIAGVQWNHPLLARLFDPTFGDLAQVSFQGYYQIKPVSQKAEFQVIAAIGDKAPALMESALGAGKILLFNTTANDAWTDLPRRKSYVPLLDRMLDHLAGGLRRGMFEVGDAVILPLPRADRETKVTVTTPGGQKARPALRTVAGRTVMQLDAAREVGVYRVSYSVKEGTESFPFVVQVGRRSSPLVAADEGTLQRWWKPAAFDVTVSNAASHRLPTTESRLPLDPWMMLAAFGVLLAEMFLVHRVCPRMHPQVVSGSVVTQHGFFGPGENGQADQPEADKT